MACWWWTHLQWRTKSARRSRLNFFWQKTHWRHPDPRWWVRWCLLRLVLPEMPSHTGHTERSGPDQRSCSKAGNVGWSTLTSGLRSTPSSNQSPTPHHQPIRERLRTAPWHHSWSSHVSRVLHMSRQNQYYDFTMTSRHLERLQGSAHKTDSNKSYKLWISMSKNQSRFIINSYFFKLFLHGRKSW